MDSIQDITSRFKDGEQRYESDAEFKHAVDSIRLGVGNHLIIDNLLSKLSAAQAGNKFLLGENALLRKELNTLKQSTDG